jgi:hypothetical protein
MSSKRNFLASSFAIYGAIWISRRVGVKLFFEIFPGLEEFFPSQQRYQKFQSFLRNSWRGGITGRLRRYLLRILILMGYSRLILKSHPFLWQHEPDYDIFSKCSLLPQTAAMFLLVPPFAIF